VALWARRWGREIGLTAAALVAGFPALVQASHFGTVEAPLITLTAAGRSRAGRVPSRRVVFILATFVVLWAVDGINSFLAFFPDAPRLYAPQNWLRLAT